MKINGHKPPESVDVVRLQKPGEKNGSARPSGKPDSTDKVDLSGNAKGLGDLLSAVNRLPDVRTEKVAGIRGRIDSGKYVVDPVEIARKMVDEIV
ncbi:MAG: flagellar biosynthesis anti-sigma factor FlgM [Desulfobacteria bacterium]|nr:flagellar biosynthesis anti-sigma factor FlgM [Deltaproteobacteria bacterium]